MKCVKIWELPSQSRRSLNSWKSENDPSHMICIEKKHMYMHTLCYTISFFRCDQDRDGKISYVDFTKYLIGTPIHDAHTHIMKIVLEL